MSKRQPAAVPTAEAMQRERDALELRRAGATYDAIADRLGYTNRGAAYKAVQRGLRRTIQEPADELRQLEVERLDRLLTAVWRSAMGGNLGAVDRVLRVAERRARLLGLDAPTKIETEGAVRYQIVGIPPELLS